MAYVISEDCIACGTCIGECPSEAISEGDISQNVVHVLMFVPMKQSAFHNSEQAKKIEGTSNEVPSFRYNQFVVI